MSDPSSNIANIANIDASGYGRIGIIVFVRDKRSIYTSIEPSESRNIMQSFKIKTPHANTNDSSFWECAAVLLLLYTHREYMNGGEWIIRSDSDAAVRMMKSHVDERFRPILKLCIELCRDFKIQIIPCKIPRNENRFADALSKRF
jgi:hypothetical protein